MNQQQSEAKYDAGLATDELDDKPTLTTKAALDEFLKHQVYDITAQPGQQEGISAGGWGHPVCSAASVTISESLPVTTP
jgi:hypothetical protein